MGQPVGLGEYIGLLRPEFGIALVCRDSVSEVIRSFSVIRDLLHRYAVVLLRGREWNDEALRDLGAAVGNGRFELSARSLTHAHSVPEVSNLTNILRADGSVQGYGGATTDYWHADQEFRQNPATLALLYCHIQASGGGGTTFVSTRESSINLPAIDIEELDNSEFCRRPSHPDDHDNAPQQVVSHPAVLRQPLTGERCYYITEHCFTVDSQGQVLRSPLLRRTLAALTHSNRRYSHDWRPGDLLIFDNSQLIHRREAFTGDRWLKSLKVFAPEDEFCIPPGRVIGRVEDIAPYH